MKHIPVRALGVAVALTLSACGGDEGAISSPYPPPSTTDSMSPAAWSFGPVIDGSNRSVGLPTHPSAHPEGWAFEMPQPNAVDGHVHYVTMSRGSLAGKSRVVLKYRIEAAEDVKFYPTKYYGTPAILTLYFQREGDDWSGTGKYETYRWWATFATVGLKSGEGEIIAPLDGNWTAVQTSSARTASGAFADAKANAAKIGFTFGGGDGYGHGAYATGPAKFIVTDFHVE